MSNYASGQRAQSLLDALTDPKVQMAMAERCVEEGHSYVGACTAFFQIYQQCRWCGEAKALG